MGNFMNLKKLNIFEDIVLFGFRILVGVFLIWGVFDNMMSARHMAVFAEFLKAHRFPEPEMLAWVSVYVQFACGLGFLTGLLIRWAGLLCAVNFAVAVIMVDGPAGVRPSFASAMLVMFGLYVAAHGAGHYSLERCEEKQ